MTQLMQAMILGFWLSISVVLIATVKLMACEYGDGLYSCGALPYLAFLLGGFAIIGTLPFVLVDLVELVNQNPRPEDTE